MGKIFPSAAERQYVDKETGMIETRRVVITSDDLGNEKVLSPFEILNNEGKYDRREKEAARELVTKEEIRRRVKGCFITTAVCQNGGLEDNCDILNTLRDFRDNYMNTDSERKKLVQKYYEIAPGIVNGINNLKDKDLVYQTLMTRFIMPSYESIKEGNNEEAMKLYTNCVKFAQNKSLDVKLLN